jgi:hypothetical protein
VTAARMTMTTVPVGDRDGGASAPTRRNEDGEA